MIRWLIRAGVSAAVVAILVAIVPVDIVFQAVRRTSVWTWSSSVAIFVVGHYLNAMKLRLLLGPAPGLAAACVRAQYAGLAANVGLPGAAGGDFVRAAYLTPLVGLKRVAVASVADRLIDTGTVIALIAIALPIAGLPPGIAQVVERAGMRLAVIAAVVLLIVVVLSRLPRLAGVMTKAKEGWQLMADRRSAVAGAMAISLMVQSAFVMTNVWLATEVGVATGLSAWFVAWPMAKLIAVLPISLGGLGIREAALVSLLAPYGAPREAVLASGILWQTVLIVTGVAGLVVTQLWPRRQIHDVTAGAKDA